MYSPLKTVICALLCLGAFACGPTNTGPSPYAPGYDRREKGVDGLIVGHRLMAAGEYFSARKAYLRAGADNGLTVDVLSAIGSADLKLGRLGQAEANLRKALEKDPKFVPAHNNLGVTLMEQGRAGEAKYVFQTAFALDAGKSAAIRENLRLAIAKIDDVDYSSPNKEKFRLMRRGAGDYLILGDN